MSFNIKHPICALRISKEEFQNLTISIYRCCRLVQNIVHCVQKKQTPLFSYKLLEKITNLRDANSKYPKLIYPFVKYSVAATTGFTTEEKTSLNDCN